MTHEVRLFYPVEQHLQRCHVLVRLPASIPWYNGNWRIVVITFVWLSPIGPSVAIILSSRSEKLSKEILSEEKRKGMEVVKFEKTDSRPHILVYLCY